MSSLADMLRKAASSNDDTDKSSYSPDPMAQAMELRERFARLSAVETFAPGDIVRGKLGIGLHKVELRVTCVVLRLLDHTNAYDAALTRQWLRESQIGNAGMMPDLVIGTLIGTSGKQIVANLIASATIEHVSNADLAAWNLPKD